MQAITLEDLLKAGVHFGHLKSKWDPSMAPYIYTEKNGIHLLDLNKTKKKLEDSQQAIKNIARSGRKILFIATKKQAKDIVTEAAREVNMPFVTERWLGGMLTNFATVRKSIKKMNNIDKMMSDGTVENLAKRERLQLTRERAKLERILGGITDLKRIPAAVFVVDIKREHIAIAESHRLNLTSFGIVDTNSDPREVDYAIPANDDSSKSIELLTNAMTEAVKEGLAERKSRMAEEQVEKEEAERAKKEKEQAKAEDAPAAEATEGASDS